VGITTMTARVVYTAAVRRIDMITSLTGDKITLLYVFYDTKVNFFY